MGRRLGQHFLIDESIIKKQIRWLEGEHMRIVEIGGGRGALTEHLVPIARSLTVIEKDPRLAWFLRTRFRAPTVTVITGDVRSTPLPPCDRIIGNIPYYISSSLIFDVLLRIPEWSSAVLMVQKEFGERMCASPGTSSYGRLSVMSHLYFSVERLASVPRTAFAPPPRVDSVVIRLKRKSLPFSSLETPSFTDFIRRIFPYRKKTLKNALSHANISAAHITPSLLSQRVFQLSPDTFVTVWRMCGEKRKD